MEEKLLSKVTDCVGFVVINCSFKGCTISAARCRSLKFTLVLSYSLLNLNSLNKDDLGTF